MMVANIEIIYQDHYLLAVNKPMGLVMHPTYKHADGTLWDALLAYLERQGSDDWRPPVLPDDPGWALAPPHVQTMLRERRIERQWKEDGLLPHPCLLHRLDKDTTGIVLLARTERARRHVVRQFYEHTIVKRYLAVVSLGAPLWAVPRTSFVVQRVHRGEVPQSVDAAALFDAREAVSYILDGPLQRDPDDRRRCIVGPDGQEARTRVSVLATQGRYALLDVRPITGRTHQIRAHLAALGYSLVGDPLYGKPSLSSEEGELRRQFLHAYSLTLRGFPNDVQRTFVAPLAADLVAWLERHLPTALLALSSTSS